MTAVDYLVIDYMPTLITRVHWFHFSANVRLFSHLSQLYKHVAQLPNTIPPSRRCVFCVVVPWPQRLRPDLNPSRISAKVTGWERRVQPTGQTGGQPRQCSDIHARWALTGRGSSSRRRRRKRRTSWTANHLTRSETDTELSVKSSKTTPDLPEQLIDD